MKICVVGAGAAGLCAIRHSLAHNCDVIAFEQTNKIGGTWIYTDETGTDKLGNEIHSSMYRNLSTNLPKELMSFPEFPFQQHEKSFVSHDDVNNYLNLYADKFALRQFIKFSHSVHRIRPLSDGNWEVVVKNLSNESYEIFIFDAIFVCNGHFSTPSLPNIQGWKKFYGTQSHSHDYRNPEKFHGRKVLVLGGGPSGVDISQDIAKCAGTVFWSNHLSPRKPMAMENLIQKPDVVELIGNEVAFDDGTKEIVNDIVYCTGYKYTFPFISVDCGLATDENYVRPLYKHCLNINNPTMAIIGLPVYVCPFQMFDLQIRFALTFMTQRKSLPTREDMLKDTSHEMNARWARGLSTKKAHSMGKNYQDVYYDELATSAEIEPIKQVILKMYNRNRENQVNDVQNYRKFKFTIVNNEEFEAEIE